MEGGEALAVFDGGYYSGMPALVRKAYLNGGSAYYLGAGFDKAMVEEILRSCSLLSPYAQVIRCPSCVELACREKEGTSCYFVLNFDAEPQTINVLELLEDMLTGEAVSGQLTLEPYGVKVLRATLS